jgi:hypothetical protein
MKAPLFIPLDMAGRHTKPGRFDQTEPARTGAGGKEEGGRGGCLTHPSLLLVSPSPHRAADAPGAAPRNQRHLTMSTGASCPNKEGARGLRQGGSRKGTAWMNDPVNLRSQLPSTFPPHSFYCRIQATSIPQSFLFITPPGVRARPAHRLRAPHLSVFCQNGVLSAAAH